MNEQKLQNIRQAEQSAKTLLNSVEESKNAMIRNTHSKALEILDEVKKSVRDYEVKVLSDFQHTGSIKANEILSELDREIKDIDNLADRSEVQAISFLQNEMKVFYGNC